MLHRCRPGRRKGLLSLSLLTTSGAGPGPVPGLDPADLGFLCLLSLLEPAGQKPGNRVAAPWTHLLRQELLDLGRQETLVLYLRELLFRYKCCCGGAC